MGKNRKYRVKLCKALLKDLPHFKIHTGPYIDPDIAMFQKEQKRHGTAVATQLGMKYGKSQDLQEVAEAIKKNCTCCFIGALFVKDVERNDNFPVDRVLEKDGRSKPELNFQQSILYGHLAQHFDKMQLALMETAFMGSDFVSNVVSDDDLDIDDDTVDKMVDNAILFGEYAGEMGEKYHDDRDIVEAILKNVIKNEGVFVPKVKKSWKKEKETCGY